MGNMLTTKEVELVSDLLTVEENICKKARLYARTLTDASLVKALNAIADNHQERFNKLLELL